MRKQIIQTENIPGEEIIERSLRPKKLDDYIGQEKLKDTMRIYIEASKKRGEALDHVLLYGPPGLGKTTLSMILANELGVNIKITSGPAIEKPGDIAGILNNIKPNDILFIDEIHRIPRQVEEVLYSAMEDFAIDIMIGKGPTSKSIRLDLPPFTLIGATTRAGMLSEPLRDRFGVVNRLEFYNDDELTTIILNSAKRMNVKIEKDAALELAKRSRGTPRIANRMLRRVRDFAEVKGNGIVDLSITKMALELLDVDSEGLDNLDKRILDVIINNFNGGPVGLDTLASAIGEDSGTIEDVYEPFLIKKGFLDRTPRGRKATNKAYEHLGMELINNPE